MLEDAVNQDSELFSLRDIGDLVCDNHPASIWVLDLDESLETEFDALRYSCSDWVGLQQHVSVGVPSLGDRALLVIADCTGYFT